MTRAPIQVERRHQQDHDGTDDVYADFSPAERVGMMWRLALDAWAFIDNDTPQPRLSRRVVVLQRRAR